MMKPYEDMTLEEIRAERVKLKSERLENDKKMKLLESELEENVIEQLNIK